MISSVVGFMKYGVGQGKNFGAEMKIKYID